MLHALMPDDRRGRGGCWALHSHAEMMAVMEMDGEGDKARRGEGRSAAEVQQYNSESSCIGTVEEYLDSLEAAWVRLLQSFGQRLDWVPNE